jgi:hypothetical protein
MKERIHAPSEYLAVASHLKTVGSVSKDELKEETWPKLE